jgi:hypothetical protein
MLQKPGFLDLKIPAILVLKNFEQSWAAPENSRAGQLTSK